MSIDANKSEIFKKAKEKMDRMLKAHFGPFNSDGINKLPGVYSNYLKSSVLERFRACGRLSKAELFSNREELQLAKTAEQDVIALYHHIQEVTQKELDQLETLDGGEVERERVIQDVLQKRVAAGGIMMEVLHRVVDLSGKIQAIENGKQNAVSTQDFENIVNKFVGDVYTVLGSDESMLPKIKELAKRMRATKIANGAPQGTTITPDQDVIEMDATIPKLAG